MQKIRDMIDKVSTIVSSVLCAAMMIILFVNIVLRYTPGMDGFTWYMEGAQYLNVWSMLIVGIAISVQTQHLKVNIAEDLSKGVFKKVNKIVVAVFTLIFYMGMAYGGYLLATKARQSISTMPSLKMSYVYWMIPVTAILCAISVVIGLICDLQAKEDKA